MIKQNVPSLMVNSKCQYWKIPIISKNILESFFSSSIPQYWSINHWKFWFILDNFMEKVQFFISFALLLIMSCQSAKTSWGHQQKIPQKVFFFFLVARVNKTFLFDQHLFTRKILNAVADWTYSVGIMWRAESVYESK
jgi:hypothetical protein